MIRRPASLGSRTRFKLAAMAAAYCGSTTDRVILRDYQPQSCQELLPVAYVRHKWPQKSPKWPLLVQLCVFLFSILFLPVQVSSSVACVYSNSTCSNCAALCNFAQFYHLLPSSCHPDFPTSFNGDSSFSFSGNSFSSPSDLLPSSLSNSFSISVKFNRESANGTLIELQTDSVNVTVDLLSGVVRVILNNDSVLITSSESPENSWRSIVINFEEIATSSLNVSIYVDGLIDVSPVTFSIGFPSVVESVTLGNGYSGLLSNTGLYLPALTESDLDPSPADFLPQCLCYPDTISTTNPSDCSTMSNRYNVDSHVVEFLSDNSSQTYWQSAEGDTPVSIQLGLSSLTNLSKIFVSFESLLPSFARLDYSVNAEWEPLQYWADNCSTRGLSESAGSADEAICTTLQNGDTTLAFKIAAGGRPDTSREDIFATDELRLIMEGFSTGESHYAIREFEVCMTYCADTSSTCDCAELAMTTEIEQEISSSLLLSSSFISSSSVIIETTTTTGPVTMAQTVLTTTIASSSESMSPTSTETSQPLVEPTSSIASSSESMSPTSAETSQPPVEPTSSIPSSSESMSPTSAVTSQPLVEPTSSISSSSESVSSTSIETSQPQVEATSSIASSSESMSPTSTETSQPAVEATSSIASSSESMSPTSAETSQPPVEPTSSIASSSESVSSTSTETSQPLVEPTSSIASSSESMSPTSAETSQPPVEPTSSIASSSESVSPTSTETSQPLVEATSNIASSSESMSPTSAETSQPPVEPTSSIASSSESVSSTSTETSQPLVEPTSSIASSSDSMSPTSAETSQPPVEPTSSIASSSESVSPTSTETSQPAVEATSSIASSSESMSPTSAETSQPPVEPTSSIASSSESVSSTSTETSQPAVEATSSIASSSESMSSTSTETSQPLVEPTSSIASSSESMSPTSAETSQPPVEPTSSIASSSESVSSTSTETSQPLVEPTSSIASSSESMSPTSAETSQPPVEPTSSIASSSESMSPTSTETSQPLVVPTSSIASSSESMSSMSTETSQPLVEPISSIASSSESMSSMSTETSQPLVEPTTTIASSSHGVSSSSVEVVSSETFEPQTTQIQVPESTQALSSSITGPVSTPMVLPTTSEPIEQQTSSSSSAVSVVETTTQITEETTLALPISSEVSVPLATSIDQFSTAILSTSTAIVDQIPLMTSNIIGTLQSSAADSFTTSSIILPSPTSTTRMDVEPSSMGISTPIELQQSTSIPEAISSTTEVTTVPSSSSEPPTSSIEQFTSVVDGFISSPITIPSSSPIVDTQPTTSVPDTVAASSLTLLSSPSQSSTESVVITPSPSVEDIVSTPPTEFITSSLTLESSPSPSSFSSLSTQIFRSSVEPNEGTTSLIPEVSSSVAQTPSESEGASSTLAITESSQMITTSEDVTQTSTQTSTPRLSRTSAELSSVEIVSTAELSTTMIVPSSTSQAFLESSITSSLPETTEVGSTSEAMAPPPTTVIPTTLILSSPTPETSSLIVEASPTESLELLVSTMAASSMFVETSTLIATLEGITSSAFVESSAAEAGSSSLASSSVIEVETSSPIEVGSSPVVEGTSTVFVERTSSLVEGASSSLEEVASSTLVSPSPSSTAVESLSPSPTQSSPIPVETVEVSTNEAILTMSSFMASSRTISSIFPSPTTEPNATLSSMEISSITDTMTQDLPSLSSIVPTTVFDEDISSTLALETSEQTFLLSSVFTESLSTVMVGEPSSTPEPSVSDFASSTELFTSFVLQSTETFSTISTTSVSSFEVTPTTQLLSSLTTVVVIEPSPITTLVSFSSTTADMTSSPSETSVIIDSSSSFVMETPTSSFGTVVSSPNVTFTTSSSIEFVSQPILSTIVSSTEEVTSSISPTLSTPSTFSVNATETFITQTSTMTIVESSFSSIDVTIEPTVNVTSQVSVDATSMQAFTPVPSFSSVFDSTELFISPTSSLVPSETPVLFTTSFISMESFSSTSFLTSPASITPSVSEMVDSITTSVPIPSSIVTFDNASLSISESILFSTQSVVESTSLPSLSTPSVSLSASPPFTSSLFSIPSFTEAFTTTNTLFQSMSSFVMDSSEVSFTATESFSIQTSTEVTLLPSTVTLFPSSAVFPSLTVSEASFGTFTTQFTLSVFTSVGNFSSELLSETDSVSFIASTSFIETPVLVSQTSSLSLELSTSPEATPTQTQQSSSIVPSLSFSEGSMPVLSLSELSVTPSPTPTQSEGPSMSLMFTLSSSPENISETIEQAVTPSPSISELSVTPSPTQSEGPSMTFMFTLSSSPENISETIEQTVTPSPSISELSVTPSPTQSEGPSMTFMFTLSSSPENISETIEQTVTPSPSISELSVTPSPTQSEGPSITFMFTLSSSPENISETIEQTVTPSPSISELSVTPSPTQSEGPSMTFMFTLSSSPENISETIEQTVTLSPSISELSVTPSPTQSEGPSMTIMFTLSSSPENISETIEQTVTLSPSISELSVTPSPTQSEGPSMTFMFTLSSSPENISETIEQTVTPSPSISELSVTPSPTQSEGPSITFMFTLSSSPENISETIEQTVTPSPSISELSVTPSPTQSEGPSMTFMFTLSSSPENISETIEQTVTLSPSISIEPSSPLRTMSPAASFTPTASISSPSLTASEQSFFPSASTELTSEFNTSFVSSTIFSEEFNITATSIIFETPSPSTVAPLTPFIPTPTSSEAVSSFSTVIDDFQNINSSFSRSFSPETIVILTPTLSSFPVVTPSPTISVSIMASSTLPEFSLPMTGFIPSSISEFLNSSSLMISSPEVSTSIFPTSTIVSSSPVVTPELNSSSLSSIFPETSSVMLNSSTVVLIEPTTTAEITQFSSLSEATLSFTSVAETTSIPETMFFSSTPPVFLSTSAVLDASTSLLLFESTSTLTLFTTPVLVITTPAFTSTPLFAMTTTSVIFSPTPTPTPCVIERLPPLAPLLLKVDGLGLPIDPRPISQNDTDGLLYEARIGAFVPIVGTEDGVSTVSVDFGEFSETLRSPIPRQNGEIIIEAILASNKVWCDHPFVDLSVQVRDNQSLSTRNLNQETVSACVDQSTMCSNCTPDSESGICIINLHLESSLFNIPNDSIINVTVTHPRGSSVTKQVIIHPTVQDNTSNNISIHLPAHPVFPGDLINISIHALYEYRLLSFTIKCSVEETASILGFTSPTDWSTIQSFPDGNINEGSVTGFRNYDTDNIDRMDLVTPEHIANMSVRIPEIMTEMNISVTCEAVSLLLTTKDKPPVGVTIIGVLTVQPNSVVKYYAYLTTNQLINIASLTHEPQRLTLFVQAFYKDGSIRPVTEGIMCFSDNEQIVKVEGSCGHAFLNGSETSSGETTITIRNVDNGKTEHIPFKVWLPSYTQFKIENDTLNRVCTPESMGNDVSFYQTTYIRVLTILVSGEESIDVYITSLLLPHIYTNDSGVITIDRNSGRVIPISAGVANIYIMTGSIQAILVEVSDNTVYLCYIDIFIFNAIEVIQDDTSSDSESRIEIRLHQNFTFINSDVSVVGVAIFNDGRRQVLERNSTLIEPLLPESLHELQENKFSLIHNVSEIGFSIRWSPGDYESNIVDDKTLNFNSSIPESLHVSVSQYRIAHSEDPARYTGTPTTSKLTVLLVYPNNHIVDITDNTNTRIDAGDLVEVNKEGVISASQQSMNGSASITVQFEFMSGEIMSEEISVEVVRGIELTISAYPYPHPEGSRNTAVSTIKKIGSVFQEVEIEFTVTNSDGSRGRVAFDQVHINEPLPNLTGDILSLPAEYSAVPVRINASVETLNGVLDLTVEDSRLEIRNISNILFVPSDLNTYQIKFTVTFEGNISNSAIETSEYPSLVNFSSDPINIVNISGTGLLTVLSNFHRNISVCVSSSTGVSVCKEFSPNLHPQNGEIDLGASSGLPLVPVTIGNESTITVPVYLRLDSQVFGIYEMELSFNSEIVMFKSLTQGGDWESGQIVFVPPGGDDSSVSFGGILHSGTNGSRIHLANVTFLTISAGEAHFTTNVTFVAKNDVNASIISVVKPISSNPSQISVEIKSARRRRDADEEAEEPPLLPPPLLAVEENLQRLRRQSDPNHSNSDAVPGDTNEDGRVDLRDVYRLQLYVAESVFNFSSTTGMSLQQNIDEAALDLDGDGMISLDDIQDLESVTLNLAYEATNISASVDYNNTIHKCLVEVRGLIELLNGETSLLDVEVHVVFGFFSTKAEFIDVFNNITFDNLNTEKSSANHQSSYYGGNVKMELNPLQETEFRLKGESVSLSVDFNVSVVVIVRREGVISYFSNGVVDSEIAESLLQLEGNVIVNVVDYIPLRMCVQPTTSLPVLPTTFVPSTSVADFTSTLSSSPIEETSQMVLSSSATTTSMLLITSTISSILVSSQPPALTTTLQSSTAVVHILSSSERVGVSSSAPSSTTLVSSPLVTSAMSSPETTSIEESSALLLSPSPSQASTSTLELTSLIVSTSVQSSASTSSIQSLISSPATSSITTGTIASSISLTSSAPSTGVLFSASSTLLPSSSTMSSSSVTSNSSVPVSSATLSIAGPSLADNIDSMSSVVTGEGTTSTTSSTEETLEPPTETSTTDSTQPTVSPSQTGLPTEGGNENSSKPENPTATIVGAVLGIIISLLVLVIAGCGGFMIIRRKKGHYMIDQTNGVHIRRNSMISNGSSYWRETENGIEMSPQHSNIDIVPLEHYGVGTNIDVVANHSILTSVDPFGSNMLKPLIGGQNGSPERGPPKKGGRPAPLGSRPLQTESYIDVGTAQTGTTMAGGYTSSSMERSTDYDEDEDEGQLVLPDYDASQAYLSLGLTPLSQLSPDAHTSGDFGYFPSMPPPVAPSTSSIFSTTSSSSSLAVDNPFSLHNGSGQSNRIIDTSTMPDAIPERRRKPKYDHTPLSQGFPLKLEPVMENPNNSQFSGKQNGFSSSEDSSKGTPSLSTDLPTDFMFPAAVPSQDFSRHSQGRTAMRIRRPGGKGSRENLNPSSPKKTVAQGGGYGSLGSSKHFGQFTNKPTLSPTKTSRLQDSGENRNWRHGQRTYSRESPDFTVHTNGYNPHEILNGHSSPPHTDRGHFEMMPLPSSRSSSRPSSRNRKGSTASNKSSTSQTEEPSPHHKWTPRHERHSSLDDSPTKPDRHDGPPRLYTTYEN